MDWFEASEEVHQEAPNEGNIANQQVMQDAGGVSIERMEEYELNQTLQLLIATDEKLYNNSLVVEEKMVEEEDSNPRYYSEGYEANYEGVTDAEIKKWQEHFPYLMVVGKSIQGLGAEVSSRDAVSTGSEHVEHFFENTQIDASTLDLAIEGHRMHIYPINIDSTMNSIDSVDEEGEEIIAQDGVLEEILALDVDPALCEDQGLEDLEELDDIKRNIWLSVVDRLRPLVQQALRYADEHDVCSDLRALDAQKSSSQDWQDDNDDDVW